MRAPVLAVLAVLLASEAPAFDVDRCGLVVPTGEVGHVVSDLSCPASLEAAVYLDPSATLSLGGHRILGDGGGEFGIACLGSCTVTGPGEIGVFKACITASYARRATATDLEVHHCETGILAPDIRATNVFAHHHEKWAFGVLKRMKGVGLTADDNGLHGFFGPKLVLENSAMRRNGSHAVFADVVFKGTNVAFEDNLGAGVVGGRIKGTGLTATGNQQGGVSAHPSLSLRDSTLVENPVYDVASERQPSLRDTECGKSLRAPAPFGSTWNVCTDD
jgi:hypothetical protein